MLYTIHRYPTHLIDVVSLSDGRRLTVRPVLPQDDAGTQAFVCNLSKQSRYNRFFRVLTELPPACLRRFTEVDYQSHVALVATSFSEGREVLVAEARYAIKDDPTVAEWGIAVADAWQRMGVGTLMLRRIEACARASGVRRLLAESLGSNEPMLRLARKLGFSVTLDPDDRTLLCLRKELEPATREAPASRLMTVAAA